MNIQMKKIAWTIVSVLFILHLCSGSLAAQGLKYPALSDNTVVLQGDSAKWDSNKVHTLSVVEVNRDGYRYWGYYGLSYYGGDANLRKGGLARSNDLVHWDKYAGNPIINGDCRWPNVIVNHSLFYMFYAEYDSENNSRIVMVSSKDGISFGNKEVVVPRERGRQNQNPFIYLDPKDGYFNLAYYSGTERSKDTTKNVWRIKLRRSKDIATLKDAPASILLSSKNTLAAPSLVWFDNRYYLLAEARIPGKWESKWVTLAFQSAKIGGKYRATVDAGPVLSNDDACAFQYVLDGQLYIFYSHCLDDQRSNWDLRMVRAAR